MAKRRRLSPANPSFLDGKPPLSRFADDMAQPEATPKRAPIADVASEASAQAALEELSDVLSQARSKGLMIEELPLGAIDKQHLVRDRIATDPDEMTALRDSLRARGQQTPIEVVKLAKTGGVQRYGLISGWRRMLALQTLAETDPDQGFDKVLARIIQPDTAQAAYVAMVEENEIRVNLSHYERARIAVKAMQEGVYETQKQALQGLFGNVARSKRSKIGSFMRLVSGLDDILYHPALISEKLGLALVREINHHDGFLDELRTTLTLTDRSSPEVEMEVLVQAVKISQGLQDGPVHIPEPWELKEEERKAEEARKAQAPQNTSQAPSAPSPAPKASSAPAERQVIHEVIHEGLSLAYRPDKGRIELSGPAVTEDLKAALEDWLKAQTGA